MRRLLYFIMSLVVVGLVGTSCENKSITGKLDDLDTLIHVCPDSVYAVLDSMDTQQMSRSQRMRHALLHADAQNKAYIDFTTDSVMLDVVDYYDKHGTPNEQMRAHYLLGCTYRDLNDVPMELQCFQDAVEKADTTSKDCDLYTLSAIYGQMADIYHNQFLPQEELKALSMCEEIAKKDGDILYTIVAYGLKIRPYYLLDKKNSVLAIAKEARTRYLKYGETKRAALLLYPIIQDCIDRQDYVNAKTYINIFKKESGYFDKEKKLNKQEAVALYDIGRFYLHENKIDSASYCFSYLQACELLEASYHGFMLLFEKTNKPDSIAKYAKLYAQANDSSYISMNSEYIERMTASYNYSHQKNIAQKNLFEKEKEKEKNLVLIIMLISILFIISFITFFALNHYKKVKLEHARKEDILYRSYNNTIEKIRYLEQERDKYSLLRDTNEEYIIKLQQLKKELEEYKQDKEELIKKLEQLGNSKKEINYKAWLENFQQNQVLTILWEKLIKVKPDDNKPISRQVWNDVYSLFMKECPRFIAFIESPEKGLIDLDKKVIMLSISGFKTSDISVLLEKSKQQISNTHSRIKTKLYPDLDNTHLLKKELLTTLRKTLE